MAARSCHPTQHLFVLLPPHATTVRQQHPATKQDAKAPNFKEISKLVQEPRMDTLSTPNVSAL